MLANWKIPDLLAQSTFLGEAETASKLAIKSRFYIMDFTMNSHFLWKIQTTEKYPVFLKVVVDAGFVVFSKWKHRVGVWDLEVVWCGVMETAPSLWNMKDSNNVWHSLFVWVWSNHLTHLCLRFPFYNGNNNFSFLLFLPKCLSLLRMY